MKKKQLFVFCMCLLLGISFFNLYIPTKAAEQQTFSGTVYYIDAEKGDDHNIGTSPDAPWATMAQINGLSFKAGDAILLAGGQIHNGSLSFGSDDRGSAEEPITISSYGDENAVINSGTATGIYLGDTAGFHISNLKLMGSGRETNTGDGISLWNGGGGSLDYLLVENVEITGYKQSGIFLGVNGNGHTLKNAVVQNCLIYEIGGNGICTWGGESNIIDNLCIYGTVIYDISAVPGDPSYLGNGIVLGMVKNTEIAGCVAYECGGSPMNGAGCVGMWCYQSTNVLIQKNESFGNNTTLIKGVDGGGFDFDQYTTNSILQYNYSHNNHGAGYLLCANGPSGETFSGNTVRFNISVNDGRRSGYGAITLYGRVQNSEIYHNSLYVTPSEEDNRGETPKGIYIWNQYMETYDVKNVAIRNNIIQTTDGLPHVFVSQGQIDGGENIVMQGNCYYAEEGLLVNWGVKTFRTMEEYRLAGFEMMDGVETGLFADPMFQNAGAEPTIGTAWGSVLLEAYRIAPDSPCVDAAVDLRSLGIDIGETDYWGNSIEAITLHDIGAHETGVELTIAAEHEPTNVSLCSSESVPQQTVTIINNGNVEIGALSLQLIGEYAMECMLNTENMVELLAPGEKSMVQVSFLSMPEPGIYPLTLELCSDAGMVISCPLTFLVEEHDAVYCSAEVASCEKEGWEEYWICSDCHSYFSDEACQNLVSYADLIVQPVGHVEAELRNQKNATCEAEGYSGDWICPVCQCVLESGQIEPMHAHNYADGICSMCQAADPDQDWTVEENLEPKHTKSIIWIIILVFACAFAGTMLYVWRKRKH